MRGAAAGVRLLVGRVELVEVDQVVFAGQRQSVHIRGATTFDAPQRDPAHSTLSLP